MYILLEFILCKIIRMTSLLFIYEYRMNKLFIVKTK